MILRCKNYSQIYFTRAEEESSLHGLKNLTNRILVNINFQLDASDFIYVKYDVLINTFSLFYLQEDLTFLCEYYLIFMKSNTYTKNVRLKDFRENAGRTI